MKFIDEFRDGRVAQGLAWAIQDEARADRRYHFMEFCGGHTHAISRYGVSDLRQFFEGDIRFLSQFR